MGIYYHVRQILDDQEQMVMNAPEDTIWLVLGIHPQELEDKITSEGFLEHWDDRWGKLHITRLPIEIPSPPRRCSERLGSNRCILAAGHRGTHSYRMEDDPKTSLRENLP